MEAPNPFTERARITDPRRFVGRWRELSVLFERLEARRPVLLAGPPGIGKSSLLTHITQAAAVNLDRDDLEALYVDLAVLEGATAFYRLVVEALGGSGENSAALELALIEHEGPVLLCLDRAEAAIAAGWGERLLEALARTTRRGGVPRAARHSLQDFYVVAAVDGAAPALSEPFAVVTLGALAPTEVRLLAEAYLDGSGVSFTPADLRELGQLSAGHPAYLQRAAYQLYRSKLDPAYPWRAAYLEEARERPVPGAPLPPGVFEGSAGERQGSAYGELLQAPRSAQLDRPQLEGVGGALAALLPLLAALLAWQLSGSWLLALLGLLAGIALAVLVQRRA
jgi:hypothetical protein